MTPPRDRMAAVAAATVRRRTAALVAAVLSAACWGSATVMSKSLLGHFAPLTLLVVQLTASIAFLWFGVFVLRRSIRFDAPTRRASLSGLLEPGLAYTFGILGLAWTTASNASLIAAAEPVLILLLAWLLLGEFVGPRRLLLVLVAGCGLALVILPDLRGVGAGSLSGDALTVLGTLFAALYVIVTRQLVLTLDPLPLAALQQTVGLVWVLTIVGVALVLGRATVAVADVSWTILALAGASGVVQYALAFWLYLFALRHVPANVAAFYLALIPVFGVGTAHVFLGESLGLFQVVGAALIVLTVAAVSSAATNTSSTVAAVTPR